MCVFILFVKYFSYILIGYKLFYKIMYGGKMIVFFVEEEANEQAADLTIARSKDL